MMGRRAGEVTRRMELVSREDGRATISVKADLSPGDNREQDATARDQQGGPKHELTGEMVIDERTGWMLSAETNQRIRRTRMIRANGRERTVQIKVDAQVKVETIDGPGAE